MTTRVLPADARGIDAAIALLAAGQLVAAPTETVYGLAARADDAGAVARIYAAKGRPDFNPLIVHVGDASEAATLVEIGTVAARLMQRFWPGALTLVLPAKRGARVAAAVRAGLPTLAVRCPSHPIMQALIAGTGPLAAPSANRSGSLSPTRAEHVLESLGGRIPLILDAGPCAAGVESTIVAVDGEVVTLLRPGALTAERLGVVLAAAGSEITAPGQMASHYAPRQPLRMDARTASLDEWHIGFGGVRGDRTLSASGNLDEAAAALFEALHEAQASGRTSIAVAPIPDRGVGVAINDRLRRAAVR
ncbi:threonylcarbamoyl-AMP synthase [Sphingosinicellaceae bacterium]|nr:threonylcarbamoyl-AMP synthase [Sphingosinicellaceae bacterium]